MRVSGTERHRSARAVAVVGAPWQWAKGEAGQIGPRAAGSGVRDPIAGSVMDAVFIKQKARG